MNVITKPFLAPVRRVCQVDVIVTNLQHDRDSDEDGTWGKTRIEFDSDFSFDEETDE